MPRIDIHHHMLPEPFIKFMSKGAHPTASGNPIGSWNPQLTLDLMDQNGIDFSILSISETGVFFGDRRATIEVCRASNEFAADLIAKWPKRFGAFGVLPLPDVDASLKEIEHSLNHLKLDGFILHTNIDGRYLGDDGFEPVFREINKRNAVVYIHPITPPWHASAKTPIPSYICDTVSDTTRTVTSLLWNGALERHSNIKWILAHGGGTIPYIARRLTMMQYNSQVKERLPKGVEAYLRNLYYDSGLVGGSALNFLSHEVASDKILFGTDFPFAPVPYIQSFIKEFDAMSLEGRMRELIQCENALRILPRVASLFSHVRAA